jgi:ACS family tartrate transporter-like MFS transporter
MSAVADKALEPADPERSALRKIRSRLLPYLMVLYVVAFLDRVNIGYAKNAMGEDIAGFNAAYGLLAGIFFAGYVLFEVPSNLALRRFGARKWIARIMVSWGLVAAATGLCTSTTGVGAVRFVLGVMEAGFFPGVAFYLMSWLPRRHLAGAFAFFISAQVVSLIIGAPLSGLILDHIHWGGLDTWRWLFILQGLPAVLFGVITWYYLPDGPRQARWLNAAEQDWLARTLAEEEASQRAHTASGTWAVLRSRKAMLLAVTDLLLVLGAFGVTFYLPVIVQSFGDGLSYTESSLLTMIPFAVGGIFMLLNGWHSDRTGERPYHVAAAAVVGACGLMLLANTTSPATSLVALSLAAVGAYGYISAFWALPATVLSETAAPVGLAAINSVGSSGGFFGPYIVGFISAQAVTTQRGGVSGAALYALAASFVLGAVLLMGFRRVQRRAGQVTGVLSGR